MHLLRFQSYPHQHSLPGRAGNVCAVRRAVGVEPYSLIGCIAWQPQQKGIHLALDRSLIVCHCAGYGRLAPPPEVHGDLRGDTQVLPPGVSPARKAEKRLALLHIAQRNGIEFPASAPLKRQEERVVAQQAVQGRTQNSGCDRIHKAGNGKSLFLRNSRSHFIAPLGAGTKPCTIPIFLYKLIEELFGFACFMHTAHALRERLSGWSSFDQAPQQSDAL
jgi:hypothetical protein